MIDPIYKKQKPLLNENERLLYDKLKVAIGNDYLLVPQVHVEKLIAPKRWLGRIKYAVGHVSRWSVDFALFDVKTYEPLLAIELNGKSHDSTKTISRDNEVKLHLAEAGIPLLTYHNNQPLDSEELKSAIDSALSGSIGVNK